MKRRIVLLVVVIAVLVPPTLGDGLPFAETIVINNYEDQYTRILTLPIYTQCPN